VDTTLTDALKPLRSAISPIVYVLTPCTLKLQPRSKVKEFFSGAPT
jgi:hypothetical protein